MEREQNILKLFFEQCKRNQAGNYSDDRLIFDIEAAENLLTSQKELYYDSETKENALHWCARHASNDHVEILIRYLIVHETNCIEHLLRENIREESTLGILIEKSKLSYINDRLLKQLIKLDVGEYKITVGALVQMIVRSRNLKLSKDNLKVLNWIFDNFVTTNPMTVKNDILVIMNRIMDNLRRRLKDENDLWSRFPSIPIVLYLIQQKYQVHFNCPKPIGYRISETVNIPYLRDKLLPRSAHAMFCIPSEPFSANVRSDASHTDQMFIVAGFEFNDELGTADVMRLDLDYLESLHRDPNSVAIQDYKNSLAQNRPEIFAYDNDCRKLLKRFSWGKVREKNKVKIREMVQIRGKPDGQITSPAIATYSDNIIIEGRKNPGNKIQYLENLPDKIRWISSGRFSSATFLETDFVISRFLDFVSTLISGRMILFGQKFRFLALDHRSQGSPKKFKN